MRDIDRNDRSGQDVPDYDALQDPAYLRVLRDVNGRYARLKRIEPMPVFMGTADGPASRVAERVPLKTA
ncbi:hypothetical protein [Methylobacterium haplocladii]|uniref:Uncharacterized protein n=1 Tax=Methylobacterium haplocladii TaxID=1176176 RepID=A0A512IN33_9HYPH|nr:hypothetical protein [Methylobacterium haplocladii]GEO99116.1 hypothetical protein MHA02_15040 [Methylobacterium haplocladii]GJD84777.1 hypothetical protein HPGCJGGD_2660 [Methylobacterium haplocladii]GLS58367.1 hypothetical protein GCM10007887_10270 [Methylobacterium haplocladii]